MVIIGTPSIVSIAAGLPVVLIGEGIRLWGVAIAGSETRTTGPVGGSFLITRGPFAHVRNPLYVGNILVYTGAGIMADTPILAAVAFVWFFVQYSLIVSLEEEYLRTRFAAEYAAYCREVPRFLPVLRPYTGGEHDQPDIDWRRGIVSERRTLQAIGILTLLIVGLWILRR